MFMASTYSPHSWSELENFWLVAAESLGWSRQATPAQLAGSCSHDLGSRRNTTHKGIEVTEPVLVL